jgi:hypothetical protein
VMDYVKYSTTVQLTEDSRFLYELASFAFRFNS